MTVWIRPEEPADYERSVQVERLAFGAEEEAAIVEAVRDDVGSFALVAEDDGELVGHVQFSRAWVGGARVSALGPVGVTPSRQGEGIGSSLIRAGLDGARERGEIAVILLGDPAFYSRFGFGPAAALGLRNPFAGVRTSGFEIAEEDFMIAVLDERARAVTGPVRWHPAFGQAG